MKKSAILLVASAVALSACANMSQDQRFTAGGLAGAAAGYAAADALKSNKTGLVVGTLLGAAAGSSYAANSGGYRY